MIESVIAALVCGMLALAAAMTAAEEED